MFVGDIGSISHAMKYKLIYSYHHVRVKLCIEGEMAERGTEALRKLQSDK
jgi:hypothetical protein